MLKVTRQFFSVRSQLVSLYLLFQALVALPSMAAPIHSQDDLTLADRCHQAIALDGATWFDDRLQRHEQRTYVLSLEDEGLLNVEATHLGIDTPQPHIEVLDAHCRPIRTAFAIHRGHRAAVIPGAANYYLHVHTPESRGATDFRLQVAFASLDQLASTQAQPEDVEEPMDQWEELVGTQNAFAANGTQTQPEDVEEPMDQWEELVGTTQQLAVLDAFTDWRRAQTEAPQSDLQSPRQAILDDALCPRLSAGDHGDTLGCATAMSLGGGLEASMSHGALEDRDTYTFIVRQRARVIFETVGDLDLRGILYDAAGEQLTQDDEGAGHGNFHLEATLNPGRYYLRVESLDNYSGTYGLQSAVAPEHWQLASAF